MSRKCTIGSEGEKSGFEFELEFDLFPLVHRADDYCSHSHMHIHMHMHMQMQMLQHMEMEMEMGRSERSGGMWWLVFAWSGGMLGSRA